MVSRQAVAGAHLLVVVPQDQVRESLAERLSAAGHAVTAVPTGAEAMARIRL
ncbi:hypothetical protein [Actinoplanes utahensis]|uniref:hypothetical protein n=1 Tax=Actinoplanes utahensis TaxID=1869 RepID=UPI000A7E266E|nr:hypothetical protein [Actinoplanes utahensis]GIF33573.1 hypothetical protein Aut01nite_65590 [Actinoplanes utahensis]